MKNVLLVAAAAVALFGCQKAANTSNDTGMAANDTATTTAPTPAAMVTANGSPPGTYDVTAKNGTTSHTVLNPDGTYTDDAGGKKPVHGTWKVTGGKTCFDPDGDAGPTCFAETPVGADGTFTATSDKGEVVTVKRAA
jgi:hypothetical protein